MKRIIYGLLLSAVALNAAGAFAQANTSLSNLAAPTAINASLLFDTDYAYFLGSSTAGLRGVYAANVTGVDANDLDLTTPSVVSGSPGNINLEAGATSDASAPGGAVNLNGGAASGTSAQGGEIAIVAGASTGASGTGGKLVLEGGTGATGGYVDIATQPGGIIYLENSSASDYIEVIGHIVTAGIAGAHPTVSACGAGASISGNDVVGRINVGTGTATCTVTFIHAWPSNVACFINNETARIAMKVVPATSDFVVSAAANFAAGTVLDYNCLGFN